MDLIKVVNEAFATKKEYPSFKSGDTITVAYRIKEGNKERIQQYRSIVIHISGHGDKKRFTVRKMSDFGRSEDSADTDKSAFIYI